MVPTMDRICREQQGPSINKTQLKGGGGGGGGATYVLKVISLIAALTLNYSSKYNSC